MDLFVFSMHHLSIYLCTCSERARVIELRLHARSPGGDPSILSGCFALGQSTCVKERRKQYESSDVMPYSSMETGHLGGKFFFSVFLCFCFLGWI